MDKLTLHIISAYLPYKLQWIFEGSDDVHEVMGLDTSDFAVHLFSPFGDYGKCRINEGKPLLIPLSELTQDIEHNGERFVPIERISEMYGINIMTDESHHLIAPITLEPWTVIRQLCEWHFDVFNLIPRGLAVSIERQG